MAHDPFYMARTFCIGPVWLASVSIR